MTVYSKERGFTHPPRLENRPSHTPHRAPRVSVPPNYRGHAIVDGEERSLGSLFTPETDMPGGSDLPPSEQPGPRFDDLPRVSQLGDSHRRQTPTYLPAPAYAEVTASHEETEPPESGTAPTDPHKIPPPPTEHHKIPPLPTKRHPPPSPSRGILSVPFPWDWRSCCSWG